MDGGYQDRVRGVQPTDEMIDNLVKTLTELELIENTFMFCKRTAYSHLLWSAYVMKPATAQLPVLVPSCFAVINNRYSRQRV